MQFNSTRKFLLLLLTVALLAFQSSAFAQTPIYQCQIVRTHPHNPQTSTQGLFYHNNKLYESSGGFGHSFLAIAELETGTLIKKYQYENRYFAEGISPYKDKLFLLTWLSGSAFIHDLESLDYQTTVSYRRNTEAIEGWGLTYDGTQLILSSGSARLYTYDPETFLRTGSILVRDGLTPVRRLNELEYVGGMILANIWKTDTIAIIDPQSGKVEAWIDISQLRKHLSPKSGVSNGIAYDNETGRLFVTGKHWDKLFEITIEEIAWQQSIKTGK